MWLTLGVLELSEKSAIILFYQTGGIGVYMCEGICAPVFVLFKLQGHKSVYTITAPGRKRPLNSSWFKIMGRLDLG